MRTFILLLVLFTLPLSTLIGQSVEEIVAKDGFKLSSTVWDQGSKAPAILLLHQCDADQTMYAKLASKLFEKGFHVMTYDHRGIGESTSSEFNIAKAENKGQEWSKVLSHNQNDLETVMTHFLKRVKHEQSAISLLGASCSGEKVLYLTEKYTSDIQAIGILSSRMSSGPREKLRQFAHIPTIFIAAKNDRRAYETAIEGKEFSTTSQSKLITYSGSAHAKALFSKDRKLEETIAEWYALIAQSK